MIHEHEATALASAAIDFPPSAEVERELRQALASCPVCAERSAAYRDQMRLLGRLPSLQASETTRRRVADAALGRDRRGQSRVLLLVVAALLVALALAVSAFVGALVNRSTPVDLTALVPIQSASSAATFTPASAAPSPSTSIEPASPSATSSPSPTSLPSPTSSPSPSPTATPRPPSPTSPVVPTETPFQEPGESLTPTIPGTPVNDTQPGTTINALPFADTQNASRAQIHAMEPSSLCGLGGLSSVWYNFAPTTDTTVALDTFGSDYDTIIDVWIGTLSSDVANPGFENLTPLTCNDNSANTSQSAVVFAAQRAQGYVIRVSAINTLAADLVFHARAA